MSKIAENASLKRRRDLITKINMVAHPRIQDFEMGGVNFCNNVIEPNPG